MTKLLPRMLRIFRLQMLPRPSLDLENEVSELWPCVKEIPPREHSCYNEVFCVLSSKRVQHREPISPEVGVGGDDAVGSCSSKMASNPLAHQERASTEESKEKNSEKQVLPSTLSAGELDKGVQRRGMYAT